MVTLLTTILVFLSIVKADYIQREVYWSPDHRTRILVRLHRPRLYGIGESRVDVFTSRGRHLGSRDYSDGGTQGYKVAKAEWTRNSRFFVYSTESSGGHHPWRSPTHFFDRRRSQFYSLDG